MFIAEPSTDLFHRNSS